MTSIAVIGAGISGTAFAREMAAHASITLFEKSRGFGGRMATRRSDDFQFDHGAQFFTARSTTFKQFLAPLLDNGLVMQWQPKIVTLEKGKKPFKREWFEPHYVAKPSMPELARRAAGAVETVLNTRIVDLERANNQWTLIDDTGNEHGAFDWIVTSTPPSQAQDLIQDNSEIVNQLETADLSACYALMLGFSQPQEFHFDAAVVRRSPLGWIACNNSKPGREGGYSVVLHSANQWADNNLDLDQAEVVRILSEQLCTLTGVSLTDLVVSTLHRWRYARVERAIDSAFLIDEDKGIAACGDWCLGNRVEDAFESGSKLAKHLQAKI